MAKGFCETPDEKLKIVEWTGSVTTNNASTYYDAFGLYKGTVGIADLTGYNSAIWNKKLFCFVSKATDSGDGSIAYASSISNYIAVTTPKPSRTVNVTLTVCYYE